MHFLTSIITLEKINKHFNVSPLLIEETFNNQPITNIIYRYFLSALLTTSNKIHYGKMRIMRLCVYV